MVVCSLALTLRLHAAGSLKDKRRVLRSVVDRLRARFRASVAEVAFQDDLRHIGLGVAMVARDRVGIDQQLDLITRFLDADGRFELIDRQVETTHHGTTHDG